ncbi:MAG: hydrogenase maturation protease [bacterium]|nr:hydrogenase maturation protease [bacterium]
MGETLQTAIRVLGVGNVLTRDDALGPYVIQTLLAQFDFDDPVEMLDVGTPGLDFTPYLSDARAVIVVDTVHSEGPPGTIRRYSGDELISSAPLPRTNPHEPGLREALMATELSESSPGELLLIGVVPETTEGGVGLSSSVQESVPIVIEQVIEELTQLGSAPRIRTPAAIPDIWWEENTNERSVD